MITKHFFVGDPLDGTGICTYCGKSPQSEYHTIASASSFVESLERFQIAMNDILINAAKAKGYHGSELDGRKLYDEILYLAGEGHASGEIIYKLTRYRRVKDPKDIVKVAAWAFLIWDKHQRGDKN
jgi:hypothetical protein